ncbi:MAG: sulfatase [Planctomycetota bacterium]|jgi:arylsulfatase A-like enzyme
MDAIMGMVDPLNRRFLPPSGCDETVAPNFRRLAERTVTFENSYVGSMPCMPARRELHTGRYNFLHRSWGPLEPFDDSMPEILKDNGVYTHLASDHYHYWEEGGCNYHPRYSSWEISRGQEGDPWYGQVRDPVEPEHVGRVARQDLVNRLHMTDEADQPQAVTFARGMDFIRTNHAEDNWFLHIETFDPHEPFFTQPHYRDLYGGDYDGPMFDWPRYGRVTEEPHEVAEIRRNYAALVSMCDTYLGRILSMMDELGLWDDTMLIVNTDHGFLLGEHDFWAKCCQPFYNEVAHTPLFIWDPRSRIAGERRRSLVQTIDLPATLLDFFSRPLPADMQGAPLAETIATDAPVRQAGLFGLFGGHVNVTDGRYVYMRGPGGPGNAPLNEYTLMPTHMRRTFAVDELQDIALAEPFAFTKGCRTMKVAGRTWRNPHEFGTMLFDLDADPGQEEPIDDAAAADKMIEHMVLLMKANDCPPEQFERLALPGRM